MNINISSNLSSKKGTKNRMLVIGAGIGGLATAIRASIRGDQVTVYEQNSYYGGKLSQIEEKGFRFDAGPSVFTYPELVDELFHIAGKEPLNFFKYEPLEVLCNYFYEDGTKIKAYADPQRFAKELKDVFDEPEHHTLQFLEKSRELYDITSHVFLERSLHSLKTYLRKETLQSILKLHKLDAFRTMHEANQQFFQDPRLVQLFDRYATYNGSNPYEAPATLNVIPHLEHNMGGYFPERGMYSIAQSLFRLAQEVGVDFQMNTYIDRIVVKDKVVLGVEINGELIPADYVVSNMDVQPTYRKLLRNMPAPERTLTQPRSSSALIFYWGMSKRYPQLDLHNIFFSRNYQQEFEYIWQREEICDDPTIYLYISSKVQAKDAPEGKENWYCMINVPSNTNQNWDSLNEQARRNILLKLERILGISVENDIEAERILDPRGIERRTSAFQGALYGNSSNNRLAAFLRHPNFSPNIRGLYFCGGSVHPGGGIPLCLLSAKIVNELIESKYGV